jgi:cytochrome c oxidase cbb3-type subunit 1
MQDLNLQSNTYSDGVIRQFSIMAVVWGVVGMLVGVIIAAQLVWPELNLGLPWTSFGRLRPLHTNAVIFAFGGCTLFATSYYIVQRTCQTRLFMPKLAAFTFWGWQLVIVSAAISLPLGFTQSKEYAELEWPIDLLIAVVWVSYAIVFFGTIAKRNIKHIYVANWFLGAFILTVALLHIVNSAAMRCDGAMVVWPQCRGLLLDHRLLGHDVLLCAQTSRPSCLLLPFVSGAFLGLDFHLHVGWPSPFALHRFA